KNLMALKHGQVRVTMERKDITTAPATLGAGVSPTTSLVVADRVPGLIGLPLRPMVVRDLLTPGATISNNIEYVLETDNPFTTAAAVVSENTVKPETNLTFNMMSAPVRTIAHFSRASRQIMDDAPQLQSFIDGRLRYGLQFAEEGEMLNGNGTGNHLNGIIPQASAYSAAFAPPSETDIDRIRMALLQATLAYYPSTGVVLHPTDWAKMEMAKDTLGRYIIGDPQGTTAPRLWGLPVVATQAMVATHFLVGAFKLGAQIFDRMSIEVLISTEDANNFTQNMISIRAEERLALVVYRPNAFVTGTLPV
ncbi:MAG: phage major capsid protein, partial [Acetobacteraceae bacterium]